MQIELKNIKHFSAGSQETECFVATVYIDGRKAGEVRNEGYGGPNAYHPLELSRTLNAYAKTLPVETVTYGDESFELQPDADLIIGELLQTHLLTKTLKRLLSLYGIYTRKDRPGVIFATTKLNAAQKQKLIEQGVNYLPKTCNADQLLNALPFDEALAIYRSSAS